MVAHGRAENGSAYGGGEGRGILYWMGGEEEERPGIKAAFSVDVLRSFFFDGEEACSAAKLWIEIMYLSKGYHILVC